MLPKVSSFNLRVGFPAGHLRHQASRHGHRPLDEVLGLGNEVHPAVGSYGHARGRVDAGGEHG